MCNLNQKEGLWNNDSNLKEAALNAVTNLLDRNYISMTKNDYPKNSGWKEMYIITPVVKKKHYTSNCKLAAYEGDVIGLQLLDLFSSCADSTFLCFNYKQVEKIPYYLAFHCNV